MMSNFNENRTPVFDFGSSSELKKIEEKNSPQSTRKRRLPTRPLTRFINTSSVLEDVAQNLEQQYFILSQYYSLRALALLSIQSQEDENLVTRKESKVEQFEEAASLYQLYANYYHEHKQQLRLPTKHLEQSKPPHMTFDSPMKSKGLYPVLNSWEPKSKNTSILHVCSNSALHQECGQKEWRIESIDPNEYIETPTDTNESTDDISEPGNTSKIDDDELGFDSFDYVDIHDLDNDIILQCISECKEESKYDNLIQVKTEQAVHGSFDQRIRCDDVQTTGQKNRIVSPDALVEACSTAYETDNTYFANHRERESTFSNETNLQYISSPHQLLSQSIDDDIDHIDFQVLEIGSIAVNDDLNICQIQALDGLKERETWSNSERGNTKQNNIPLLTRKRRIPEGTLMQFTVANERSGSTDVSSIITGFADNLEQQYFILSQYFLLRALSLLPIHCQQDKNFITREKSNEIFICDNRKGEAQYNHNFQCYGTPKYSNIVTERKFCNPEPFEEAVSLYRVYSNYYHERKLQLRLTTKHLEQSNPSNVTFDTPFKSNEPSPRLSSSEPEIKDTIIFHTCPPNSLHNERGQKDRGVESIESKSFSKDPTEYIQMPTDISEYSSTDVAIEPVSTSKIDEFDLGFAYFDIHDPDNDTKESETWSIGEGGMNKQNNVPMLTRKLRIREGILLQFTVDNESLGSSYVSPLVSGFTDNLEQQYFILFQYYSLRALALLSIQYQQDENFVTQETTNEMLILDNRNDEPQHKNSIQCYDIPKYSKVDTERKISESEQFEEAVSLYQLYANFYHERKQKLRLATKHLEQSNPSNISFDTPFKSKDLSPFLTSCEPKIKDTISFHACPNGTLPKVNCFVGRKDRRIESIESNCFSKDPAKYIQIPTDGDEYTGVVIESENTSKINDGELIFDSYDYFEIHDPDNYVILQCISEYKQERKYDNLLHVTTEQVDNGSFDQTIRGDDVQTTGQRNRIVSPDTLSEIGSTASEVGKTYCATHREPESTFSSDTMLHYISQCVSPHQLLKQSIDDDIDHIDFQVLEIGFEIELELQRMEAILNSNSITEYKPEKSVGIEPVNPSKIDDDVFGFDSFDYFDVHDPDNDIILQCISDHKQGRKNDIILQLTPELSDHGSFDQRVKSADVQTTGQINRIVSSDALLVKGLSTAYEASNTYCANHREPESKFSIYTRLQYISQSVSPHQLLKQSIDDEIDYIDFQVLEIGFEIELELQQMEAMLKSDSRPANEDLQDCQIPPFHRTKAEYLCSDREQCPSDSILPFVVATPNPCRLNRTIEVVESNYMFTNTDNHPDNIVDNTHSSKGENNLFTLQEIKSIHDFDSLQNSPCESVFNSQNPSFERMMEEYDSFDVEDQDFFDEYQALKESIEDDIEFLDCMINQNSKVKWENYVE